MFLNVLNYLYHFKLDSNILKINKKQIRFFYKVHHLILINSTI